LSERYYGVSADRIAKYRELFDAFDSDGNGVMDKKEFKTGISNSDAFKG